MACCGVHCNLQLTEMLPYASKIYWMHRQSTGYSNQLSENISVEYCFFLHAHACTARAFLSSPWAKMSYIMSAPRPVNNLNYQRIFYGGVRTRGNLALVVCKWACACNCKRTRCKISLFVVHIVDHDHESNGTFTAQSTLQLR